MNRCHQQIHFHMLVWLTALQLNTLYVLFGYMLGYVYIYNMIWRSCSHAWACGLWWNHCTNIQNLKKKYYLQTNKKKIGSKNLKLFVFVSPPRSKVSFVDVITTDTNSVFCILFCLSQLKKPNQLTRHFKIWWKRHRPERGQKVSRVHEAVPFLCSRLPSVQANWELATPKVQADSWTSGAVGFWVPGLLHLSASVLCLTELSR